MYDRKLFAADDWGLSPGVNAGILELAKRGLLYSVSCLANSRYATHRMDELLAYIQDGVKIALHFNLTYGRPLSPLERVASLVESSSGEFYSHRQLMKKCVFAKINPIHIGTEFDSQLNTLLNMGFPVTSLDGHHHIHLLPRIAPVLRKKALSKEISQVRALRDTDHFMSYTLTTLYPLWSFRNRMPLEPCRYLLRRHLASEDSFRSKLESRAHMPLLVHPALYDDFDESGVADSMREYRVYELKMILGYLGN